jgi:hypothetical protein
LGFVQEKLELESAQTRWYRRLVRVFFALAGCLFVVRWLFSSLGNDGAVNGVMGISVLNGRLPIFYYGQNFMGALDAYVSAPLLALWGPSSLALMFWGPAFSMVTLLLVYRSLGAVFRPLSVLVGLLYLAVPPATYLFRAGKGNLHYPLGMMLSALVLWLSMHIYKAASLRPLLLFAWGLAAGLAVWTNFQTMVVVIPCTLFLLAGRLRQLRPLPVLATLAGVILGASPLIYYNLNHGLVHLSQTGVFHSDIVSTNLHELFFMALPTIMGLSTTAALALSTPESVWFWVFLGVLALVIAGAIMLFVKGLDKPSRLAWLPLLTGLTVLIVLTASQYGRQFHKTDQRYLLPLYFLLPFVWAALADVFTKKKSWPAAALAGVMVLINLSGYFDYRGIFVLNEGAFYFKQEPQIKKQIDRLRREGVKGVYMKSPEREAFLSGENPQFSHPWRSRRQYASAQVDAMTSPGYILPGLGPSLEFMGLKYQEKKLPSLGTLLHGFKKPPGSERTLIPGQWQAKALDGRDLGRLLCDGDFTTGASFEAHAAPGGFTMDLGEETDIGGFALVPDEYHHVPAGLQVEAAASDGKFKLIRKVTSYWGPFYWSGPHPFLKVRYARSECYFNPVRARFLRLTHIRKPGQQRPFSVREVLLFGPGGSKKSISWEESGLHLVHKIRNTGVSKVFADAWASAFAFNHLGSKVWTLPANVHTSDYGGEIPPVSAPLYLHPGPNTALVMEKRHSQIADRVLNLTGIEFSRHNLGRLDYYLLQGLRRGLPLPLESIKASVDKQSAQGLIKGLAEGERWGSQQPQRPGTFLELNLGGLHEVGWIELFNPDYPRDYPRGLSAWLSLDGRIWKPAPIRLAGPVVFCGPALFMHPGPSSIYRLERPLITRHVRLSLTASDPQIWWSVQKVQLRAP